MIAIHHTRGSFSDRWIEYCLEHGVPFYQIDCLGTAAVSRCEEAAAILWHWILSDPASQLVARQLVMALERAGKLVFPNTGTCWHYDDKIAQKFLLEAVQAPFVPTWVFTRKIDALEWIDRACWPKVFKLRAGAGSSNVRLVRSRREALSLCNRAFGRGFPASAGYFSDAATRLRNTAKQDLAAKVFRAPGAIKNAYRLARILPRQRGYVYFQEFLPNNDYDTRVTVIGDRAFGFRRMNRPGDFRASGSGDPRYDASSVDERCVAAAFDVARKLGTQSLAFDFLFDENREVAITEISYCYVARAVYSCEGFWDQQGGWHPGHMWPQDAIIEDMLNRISASAMTDPSSAT